MIFALPTKFGRSSCFFFYFFTSEEDFDQDEQVIENGYGGTQKRYTVFLSIGILAIWQPRTSLQIVLANVGTKLHKNIDKSISKKYFNKLNYFK